MLFIGAFGSLLMDMMMRVWKLSRQETKRTQKNSNYKYGSING